MHTRLSCVHLSPHRSINNYRKRREVMRSVFMSDMQGYLQSASTSYVFHFSRYPTGVGI
jgi:hypothetical protein